MYCAGRLTINIFRCAVTNGKGCSIGYTITCGIGPLFSYHKYQLHNTQQGSSYAKDIILFECDRRAHRSKVTSFDMIRKPIRQHLLLECAVTWKSLPNTKMPTVYVSAQHQLKFQNYQWRLHWTTKHFAFPRHFTVIKSLSMTFSTLSRTSYTDFYINYREWQHSWWIYTVKGFVFIAACASIRHGHPTHIYKHEGFNWEQYNWDVIA